MDRVHRLDCMGDMHRAVRVHGRVCLEYFSLVCLVYAYQEGDSTVKLQAECAFNEDLRGHVGNPW